MTTNPTQSGNLPGANPGDCRTNHMEGTMDCDAKCKHWGHCVPDGSFQVLCEEMLLGEKEPQLTLYRNAYNDVAVHEYPFGINKRKWEDGL